MGSLIKYILTLLITISCTAIAAQSFSYYQQHFNDENGLVQNSIKGIEIDKKGYLWLGTEMGLVRYDGINFRLYDRTNSPELKTDRFLNLGLLKNGNLFAEVAGYDFYYVDTTGKLRQMPKNDQEDNLVNYFPISEIYNIYYKCRSKYKKGQIPKWALPDYRRITTSMANSFVHVNNEYYYFNENRALIATDKALTTFRKISLKGLLSFAAFNKRISIDQVSLIGSKNDLYVRWGKYMYKLSGLINKEALAEPVFNIGYIPNITCFMEVQKAGMFIIGTASDGFYMFKKQGFSTLTLDNADANVFYSLAPYSYNGVLTSKAVLFPNGRKPISLSNYTSESILQANNGNYYLNRMQDELNSGVVELDDQLHEIRYIQGKNFHVTCFRQLKDGSIWVAAQEHAIGKIEADSIKWVAPLVSLPQNFTINSFIQTGKNEFWLAGNTGVAKLNLTNNTIHFIPEFDDIDVRCLYEDKKGTIWIGTYGNGYYAFYKGKIVAMPMDGGRFLTTAHTFLEDNSGNIWITTNRGLFQVQMKDMYDYLDGKTNNIYYYYYDKTSGFLTNEFNGGCNPSGVRLNNGMFSLPSINGLVQFYPDSIKPVFPDAQIYIDAIIGDTTIFDINSKSLSIPNKINRLQFYISSPYLGNTYNQSIDYKLENFADVWYKVSKTGIIQFNKLPSGDYRLLIRKLAGFGKGNYITKEILFSVAPLFFETWLFKLLLLASLAAMFYSFFRLRIAYLTQLKTKLQNEVLEKTKEQNVLIYNLESTVEELKRTEHELNQNNILKEELAKIITHDLQSPLRFITSTTHRIYNTLLKNEYYEAELMSLDLTRSSYQTYRFVEDFSLWLSTLGKNFQLHYTLVNLHKLLFDLSYFFTELLTVRKNQLIISVDEFLEVNTDAQLLKIILRNIIDNANKHTHGGTIYITAGTKNSTAFLVISDTGEGINKDVLRKIQAQTESVIDYADNPGKVHGHGYRFISQFSNLLDIHVEVESTKGKGTVVKLTNFKM